MTENEAKTKWCPMVRIEGAEAGQSSYNRFNDGSPDPDGRCIASDCMMWVEEHNDDKTAGSCGLIR